MKMNWVVPHIAIAAIALAALPLGACSDRPTDPPTPDNTLEETDAKSEKEIEMSGEEITDPDIAMGEIPARFQGVWDYEGGTCSPESDLRLEISDRDITFYESYGAVSGIGQDGEDAIADLVMEGEGDSWVQPTRLSLVETSDGIRLHLSDGAEPKVPDDMPRKRCEL